MSTSQNNDLLVPLEMTIRRMKVVDIANIIKNIPGLNWMKVKHRIRDNKLRFNSKDIAKIIIEHIKDTNYSTPENLKNFIALADLISISKYSSRKYWYTFIIKTNEHVLNPDMEKLISTIELILSKKYKTNLIHLYYYLYDGIAWIRIVKYKSSNYRQHGLLTYFALVLSDNYIFCNRKNPDPLMLDGLQRGLNCINIKSRELHGHIIKSLIDILRSKDNRANCIEQVQTAHLNWNQQPHCTETSAGMDFSKRDQRHEYAKQIFNETPPVVETVIFKANRLKWNRDCKFKQMAGKIYDLEVKIVAKNVNKYLKEAIEEKLIEIPAPSWCTHLLSSGKNILSLQEESPT